MKTYSEALLLQLETVIPDKWFDRVYSARSAITDSNGWHIPGKGFAFHSSPVAVGQPWILDALAERDIHLGYDIDKLGELPHFEARKRSLMTNSVSREKCGIASTEVLKFLVETFGVSESAGPVSRRTYASAGGLYPVQVLLGCKQSGKTEKGWDVLHFIPSLGAVEKLPGFADEQLLTYVGAMENFDPTESDFLLAYTLFPSVVVAKYGPRGYKFALIEVGSMQEVARRSASRYGWDSRPYGYYDEQALPNLFGLNPDNVWIEGLQFFGRGGGDDA